MIFVRETRGRSIKGFIVLRNAAQGGTRGRKRRRWSAYARSESEGRDSPRLVPRTRRISIHPSLSLFILRDDALLASSFPFRLLRSLFLFLSTSLSILPSSVPLAAAA